MSDAAGTPSDPVYQPPTEASSVEANFDQAAEMLRQTKPWVRCVSVIVFICSGLTILAGMLPLILGLRMYGPAGAGPGIVVVIVGLCMVFPASYLWAYAERTTLFLRNRSPSSLAAALDSQKSYWKMIGRVTLVCLVLVGLVFALNWYEYAKLTRMLR
jgi:hypothetical protein